MELRLLASTKMTFAAALLTLPTLLTGCGSFGSGATIASGPPPVTHHPPSDSLDASGPFAEPSSRELDTDVDFGVREPSLVEPVALDTAQSIVKENADRAAATKNQATPRRVERVDDRSFEQKVLDSDEAVLVDFYSDWCGPCKKLTPVLDELAQETPGIRIVKVNIDRSPKSASSYNVKSIPTLILFRDGKPVARHGGLIGKDSLKDLISQP